MAKFKVGDKVEILAGPKSGKVGKIETSAPGPQGSEMYHIRLEDGLLVDAIERNLTLANSAPVSTNSVVRNAIAANARMARNAKYNHQFAPEVMRFLKAALDNLKKAGSYVAFVEEMSPVASAVHSVEEAIRKLQ